jgi:hypothetical protein
VTPRKISRSTPDDHRTFEEEKMWNRKMLLGSVLIIALAGALVGVAMRPERVVRARELDRQNHGVGARGRSFTYHGIYGSYQYCSAVTAADMDRDGDLDVLSSKLQFNNYYIHQWRNDGSGSFTGSKNIGRMGATSLYVADLDDDRDMDVAAISFTHNELAAFEQLSIETNDWKRWNEGSGYALSPVGVELGGDDFILASSGRKVYLVGSLLGHQQPYGCPVASRKFISALYPDDIDRDGDLDYVAAARYPGDILWYEQNPNSGWPTCYHPEHVVDSAFPRPIWVQSGDLDGDGDADIVGAGDAGLLWWENADGKGASWTRHAITQQEFYVASSLHLADMDNDGDLDLTAATTRQLLWLENLGAPQRTANWVRHEVDTAPYTQSWGYAVVPADVNGDGQLDIVGCDLVPGPGDTIAGRRLGWWENGHTLPSAAQISLEGRNIDTTLVGAWGVDVADFDGDGRLDVAAAGYGNTDTGGQTRWYRNGGGAPLAWAQAFSSSFDDGRGVTAYAPGRARSRYLVSGNAYLGQVREFYSNDWSWSSTGQVARIANLGDTYMSAVVDLNDDGAPDILGTSAQNDSVVWWDGATGTQHVISSDCDGARAVCAGDIDHDGDLDVGAACQNEDYIGWWRQEHPLGTWSTKQQGLVWFGGATDVTCGDIDNDAKAEIVATQPDGPGWIGWFGENTYGWVTQAFTGTEQIDLADVDRDGDLDVMATSHTLNEVRWFENDGATTFSMHALDEGVDGVREITAGDLNGNGAPDIVIAAQNSGSVRWYEQLVETQLSVEKYLDPMQTAVISTGQSIAYQIDVTNNSYNGATADMLVVDRWEPPEAVAVAGSDEDCIADLSHGVMTCTLSVEAGRIHPMRVVLTPSLLFDGFITNTAQVLPVGPFWNSTGYLDTDAAAPVEVQQDMAIWDGAINLGTMPQMPVLPGQAFTYTVGMVNFGPKSNVNAWMTHLWEPVAAIDGLSVVDATTSHRHRSAADYDCYTGDVEDGVMCEFSNLAVGVPITVTIGITTSEQFTDLLEADLYFTGPVGEEGIPSNNRTVPVRVGSRPWEQVYLPLVLRK